MSETAEGPTTDRLEVSKVEEAEREQPSSRQGRRDVHTRQRLREVESERDMLQSRLDARDRATVATMAQAVLGEHGAALFEGDLEALRDPATGDVDPDLVTDALEPLRLALEEGRTHHHGDMGPRRTASTRKGATWDALLQQRR